MSVWAIVPVKPLRLAKSRLSAVLTPEERQQFAESMLRHVLSVVCNVPQVAGTLVISRDTKAPAIARQYGAHTVQETGNPELNSALTRATQVIASWRCSAVLVLPADLPLIAAEDITGILALGQQEHSVVLSTDHNQDGTNALFLRPPKLIPYAFGEGSYHRHKDLAYEAGATVREYSSERMQLDIDLPEDIEQYNQLVGNGDLKSLGLFAPHKAS